MSSFDRALGLNPLKRPRSEDEPPQQVNLKKWIKQLTDPESKFSTFNKVCTQAATGCIGLELPVPPGTIGILNPLTFKLAMPLAMSVKDAGGMELNATFAEHALMQLIMDDSFPKKVIEIEIKGFKSLFSQPPPSDLAKIKNYQFGVAAALTERMAHLSECKVVVVGNTIIVTGDVDVSIDEAKTADKLAILKNCTTDINFISSDVSFINGVPFYTDYVQYQPSIYKPSIYKEYTESIRVWITRTPQYGNPFRLAKLHRSAYAPNSSKKEPWKLTIDTRGLEKTDYEGNKVYPLYLDFKETLQHTVWRCIEEMLRAHPFYNSKEEEVTMSVELLETLVQ